MNRSLLINDADNNPFNAPPDKVDSTTFKLDRNDGFFAQVPWANVSGAGKDKTGFDAIANLEAVMIQGRASHAKRGITWDDRTGIRYLEAGLDQLVQTNDDFRFNFAFNAQGVNSPDNQIPRGVHVLVSVNSKLEVLGENAPNRVGQNGIVGGIVQYEFDPETDALLSETTVWIDGSLDSLGTAIVFADVVIVPEPAAAVPAILAAGIACSWYFAWSGVRFGPRADRCIRN
jgi:hypothetical protein